MVSGTGVPAEVSDMILRVGPFGAIESVPFSDQRARQRARPPPRGGPAACADPQPRGAQPRNSVTVSSTGTVRIVVTNTTSRTITSDVRYIEA